MPSSRIFAVAGLAAIFTAMGLALVGAFFPALLLLGIVVIAGLGMAVWPWLSRR